MRHIAGHNGLLFHVCNRRVITVTRNGWGEALPQPWQDRRPVGQIATRSLCEVACRARLFSAWERLDTTARNFPEPERPIHATVLTSVRTLPTCNCILR